MGDKVLRSDPTTNVAEYWNGSAWADVPTATTPLATDASRWGVPGCSWAGSSVGTAMTLDLIYYEPFMVYAPITVTTLGIDVTSAASAGNTARINIYTASSAWQPGTRQLSDATVAIDSTGLKSRTSLGLVLPPGPYLAAYTGQATASIRTVPMLGTFFGSNADAWSTHADRVSVAAAYAALPSSGTAWTTANLSTAVGPLHGMWMKWT